MADLHTEGWRQGSVVSAKLTATVLTTRRWGRGIKSKRLSFLRWIVCNQDCDLARMSSDSRDESVELRPVLDEDPPPNWGIRSRCIRLTEQLYADAASPRSFVSPALLYGLRSNRESLLTPTRTTAFKSWLGRRYDRPAVPQRFEGLARHIARLCERSPSTAPHEQVHDVLMRFSDTTTPPTVDLYAVIGDTASVASVNTWLARVVSRIDPKHGLPGQIDIGTRSEVSLDFLEGSYSADLSDLTWSGENPRERDRASYRPRALALSFGEQRM